MSDAVTDPERENTYKHIVTLAWAAYHDYLGREGETDEDNIYLGSAVARAVNMALNSHLVAQVLNDECGLTDEDFEWAMHQHIHELGSMPSRGADGQALDVLTQLVVREIERVYSQATEIQRLRAEEFDARTRAKESAA